MRIALCALVAGFLVSAGSSSCSSLKVTTEVYNGHLPQIAESAARISKFLDEVPARLDDVSREAGPLYAEWVEKSGGMFAGSAEEFSADLRSFLLSEYRRLGMEAKSARLRRECAALFATADAEGGRAVSYRNNPKSAQEKLGAIEVQLDVFTADLCRLASRTMDINKAAWEADASGHMVPDRVLERAQVEMRVDELQLDAGMLESVRTIAGALGLPAATVGDLRNFNLYLKKLPELMGQSVSYESLGYVREAIQTGKDLGNEAGRAIELPMGDPMVADIVGAPEVLWSKYYNHVVGTTALGNAEIAIRMETPGTYSLKGVVFDPSQVSKAVIDGLETAVLIAGAVAGAPLSLSGEGDQGSGGGNLSLSGYRVRAEARTLEQEASARLREEGLLFDEVLDALRALDGAPGANLPPERVSRLVGTVRERAQRIGSEGQQQKGKE